MKQLVPCRLRPRDDGSGRATRWRHQRGARLALATCALVLCASAAHAQGSYVAGSVSADVARMGSADHRDTPGTGEAVSWSLRAGGAITPRFGVELDFTRPSEIETDDTPDVSIYGDLSYTFLSSSTLSHCQAI